MPTDEIPWRVRENLKGIAEKMLADGETPDSERIRAAMRESLQAWQDSERKAHASWIDQRLVCLDKAREEVNRELREIRERAGFFGKAGGIPGVEKAQGILDGYSRKRLQIWRTIFLKLFGTVFCSLVIVFIAVDAFQDDAGDPSLLGWLEEKDLFGLAIVRPWLFVLLVFLLGKLFFRICFECIRRRERTWRVNVMYAGALALALVAWVWLSNVFEMRKDSVRPREPVSAVPAERNERHDKM